MTTPMPVDRTAAAVLRTDLAAAEQEWDRVDRHGDTAATARIRITVEPRMGQLRRAIAAIERDQQTRG